MGTLKGPVKQPCPACQTIQELPAIFCWHCGGPLLRISYWSIAFFLSITALAYGIFGLYSKTLFWPTPLYLYHVFIFLSLSLIITRRHYWMSFRVVLWSLLLLYAMSFVTLTASKFFHYLSTDIIEVAQHIRKSYFGIAFIGGVVLFNLILGSVTLIRRFNFTLAYRILISFLAALAYAGGHFLEEPDIGEPRKMSSLALWLPDSTIAEFLSVAAVNIARILAAEMVVYSVVTSFAPANAKFMQIARKFKSPQQQAGRPQDVLLQGTSQVTLALLRAGIYVQYFFITLGKLFANYAWGMYRVIRRLIIDLVTPVIMLALTSFLLAVIAEHTAAYLTGLGKRLVYVPGMHSSLTMIGLSVVGVFIAQMIFLAATTKFRFRELWRCSALLALWIGPFVLAVFLFISLSLVATGSVLRHFGNDTFPYHLGPLTIVAAVGLFIMVAFALLYRQRGGSSQGISAEVRKRLLLAEPAPQINEEKGLTKR